MGNWVMTIKGIGAHGNGQENDADRIMQAACDHLKSVGHRVENAEISYPAPEMSCCGHSDKHTVNGCTAPGCSCAVGSA